MGYNDKAEKLAARNTDPASSAGDPIPSRIIPESWHCIDCGVNTAPGLLNRAEAEKAFAAHSDRRIEQPIDESSEIYCVRKEVWAKTGLDCYGGCLCIGSRKPPGTGAGTERFSTRPSVKLAARDGARDEAPGGLMRPKQIIGSGQPIVRLA
jgi:hypothetical protein